MTRYDDESIPSNSDAMREHLLEGGKSTKKTKRRSKKSSKNRSKTGKHTVRRTSKKASKNSHKKVSKKSSKKRSNKKSGKRSHKRSQRRMQSSGQIAYRDFLAYVGKALDIVGGVLFKVASHYKKKAEAENPGVTGENIYKFARKLFENDSKETKNKLIEKFKGELASKKKVKKSKPSNYSETSN